jgi:hypothetical protein
VNEPHADVRDAQQLATNAASMLAASPSFQQLEPATRSAIVRDLGTIRKALGVEAVRADPYALQLETPDDFLRHRAAPSHGTNGNGTTGTGPSPTLSAPAQTPPAGPRTAATDTIAARAGALSDEINFPAFVASLVHGTFDAMVDASIRQMEEFANLVSAVAKDVEQFTEENVSLNQVRDDLAHRYPRDLALVVPSDGSEPTLHRRNPESDGEMPPSWLADYGLAGQDLTDDLIEGPLLTAARQKVGGNRMQLLATMVLLGMNRINVKDGTISARVRFRAVASDKASVNFAVGQDPGGGDPNGDQNWGTRGSGQYNGGSTMVSTVGVNVQSDSELNAELFGEVRINFVSETLPLERFVDSARLTLLQRNARSASQSPTVPTPPSSEPSTPIPPPAPAATTAPAAATTPPAAPSTPPEHSHEPPATGGR